jgi:hypothetical protein
MMLEKAWRLAKKVWIEALAILLAGWLSAAFIRAKGGVTEAWEAVRSASSAAVKFLGSPMPIPVWAFGALCVGFLVLAYFALASRRASVSIAGKPQEIAADISDPVEASVFRVIVQADGWVSLEDVAIYAGQPRLIVAAAVTKLLQKGLVRDRHSSSVGKSLILTEDGVTLAMKRGWLAPAPVNV